MVPRTILIFAGLLLLVGGCAQKSAGITTARYHGGASVQQAESPLNSLQRQAVAALEAGNHDQSILFLQRAINVDPRDPRNWHYLAQNYWHKSDYARCLEMVDRSRAYGSLWTDLERANLDLKAKCQH